MNAPHDTDFSSTEKEIGRILTTHMSFVIASHMRPDGDSIGSELALSRVLKGLFKDVRIFTEDPLPKVYDFLEGFNDIITDPANLGNSFSVLIVLDSPYLDRIGRLKDKLPQDLTIINIDHHPGNTEFGEVNYVDTSASSVGEILYRLIMTNNWEIPTPAAEALYTAILTDTGRFSHENTTAACLRIASELVDKGVDPNKVAYTVYQSYPYNLLKLKALAIEKMIFACDNKVAFIEIPYEVFVQTGVRPVDTQNFADIPRSVQGVEVGVYLREEMAGQTIKVSLRSAGRIDVNEIAKKLGGGGHPKAAGCVFSGTTQETRDILTKTIAEALKTIE